MADKHERRHAARGTLAIEHRAEQPGPGTLVGHAAVFNQRAEIWRDFWEEVAPGAFRQSIGEDDIRALWEHDSREVLGRNRARTLRLAEDDVGLAVEIDLPDTTRAREIALLIGRGDVSQMSFGFRVLDEEWQRLPTGGELRILKRVQLWDVSPVTYPAYEGTDIALQARDAWRAAQRPAFDPARLALRRRRLELAAREI